MYRFELINLIAEHIGAEKYLEIGVRRGENLGRVTVPYRVGVDPNPIVEQARDEYREGLKTAWMCKHESDVFFANNEERFDVIFVDGLHVYEQAVRDVLNGFNCLNPGGYIVVHDLLPISEAAAARESDDTFWNGDVWKIMYDFHNNYPAIQSFVVDSDFGMGVLWVDDPDVRFEAKWRKGYVRLPYSVFTEKRDEFMNVMEPDESKIRALLEARSPARNS